jgi:histidinol-phosphatase (PHP family)
MDMRFDYHVHTRFSHDGRFEPEAFIARAKELGLEELCFTEHIELDTCPPWEYTSADFSKWTPKMLALRAQTEGLAIKLGAETSLWNEHTRAFTLDYIKGQPLDFIIGSVHATGGGIDPYLRPYFDGLTKQQAYEKYVRQIAESVEFADYCSVIGHLDYVAKQAPYPDRTFSYALCPDAFDEIFKTIIPRGIGLEINTSVFKTKDEAMWGLDVFTRYRELGGEFVTIGSDAHNPERLFWRHDDAMVLARAAGIRYIATFDRLKPNFHKL